ncbi:hypothetical protein CEXT_98531 [Caerostris extrusa]|uniref:Uncharacterized protein n=1 Tax=Caerostris extrusa TaxID=172846 RepID=A0AAV4XHU5_CAEEX|nr:hypothetical protein CEXT_98531 [Caerostris extrusa]
MMGVTRKLQRRCPESTAGLRSKTAFRVPCLQYDKSGGWNIQRKVEVRDLGIGLELQLHYVSRSINSIAGTPSPAIYLMLDTKLCQPLEQIAVPLDKRRGVFSIHHIQIWDI